MRLLLSVALAACLVTPALASSAAIVNDGLGHLRIWNSHQPSLRHSLHDPAGPPCFTAAAAMADVKRAAGETVAELKGDDAEALLAGINHLGAFSEVHADTVIVVLYPEGASVALFNACHVTDLAVRLDVFADIWAKARGVRV